MKQRIDLLRWRICDLNLDLKKSPLLFRVEVLYTELAARNLRFRPPCYFADEWFVPEGDPVIGIPFYLANKQLRRLEKKIIGAVEGDTKDYFMKLLRHEAGHAISYAYRLYRLPIYRSVFGSPQKKFVDNYPYNPKSKAYVINLDDHYAQSHPDEDFAETFAVWLSDTETQWKKKYKGWKASKKLAVVASLMKDIENAFPLVKTGEKMCRVTSLRYTLATYYKRRQALHLSPFQVHEK